MGVEVPLPIVQICQEVAPKYDLDPLLVLAVIEQESMYSPKIPRLENDYYRKYVHRNPQLAHLSPVTKTLFASSYGLGQMMGLSLFEVGAIPTVVYDVQVFLWFVDYCENVRLQIETACQWLVAKKRIGVTHSVVDMLRRYNGSSEYPPKVLERYRRLTRELKGDGG